MARFGLSDKERALLEPVLPNELCGVARASDRKVLNGIFYVLRTSTVALPA